MTSFSKFSLYIVLFFSLSANAQQSEKFNAQALLDNLKTLSSDEFEGRGISTESSVRAQEFVIQKLEEQGVVPFFQTWLQDFAVVQGLKPVRLEGKNIVGVIPGTKYLDEYIAVTSHYDHLGIRQDSIYNGADDNASGTCALVSVAEYFAQNPPDHSIILAAFDGEETGLIGSKAFVDELVKQEVMIVANVNMDMIGRNINNEIFLCGKSHHAALFELFENEIKSPLSISYGHDGQDKKDDWTKASDHGSFHRADIPFVYIGEEDHPDYHMPSDDFAGIDQEFYVSVVELVIDIIGHID
jgi:hypothetical protein